MKLKVIINTILLTMVLVICTALGAAKADAREALPAPHLRGVVGQATTHYCEYEDSMNCYWDAGSSGNGRGHSFYAIRVGHKVCVIYWDRAYNRKHEYCAAL